MLIDIHTHITTAKFPEFVKRMRAGRGDVFDVDTLLRRMDIEGIDKSVVHPLNNPENMDFYGVTGNYETIEEVSKYPDRLIPFCNIDPRGMFNTPHADFSKLMQAFKDLGCLGIGEICAVLPFNHELYKNLFHHAELNEMPMLFHINAMKQNKYGILDDMGLPCLEEVLKEFPKAVFIGHAMAFWGEIGTGLKEEERDSYPKGKIEAPGRLCYLLEKYPNLYADVSAGSGCNAIKRDLDFGYKFLEKFSEKIFFGTDRFSSINEPVPEIISLLKLALDGGHISRAAYENISHRNFEKVILKQTV